MADKMTAKFQANALGQNQLSYLWKGGQITRAIKFGVGGTLAFLVFGFLLFGPKFTSIAWTATRALQDSVHQSVPVEFELQ